MTLRKMTKSAVAMVHAAVVVRAQTKQRSAIGRVAQREKTDKGVSSIQRKASGAETRKNANIQCEAWRTRPNAVLISFGRATTTLTQLRLRTLGVRRLTCGAGEELIQDDLNGVKPIQRLRLTTARDLTLVALAEVPQSNLVEVMQA